MSGAVRDLHCRIRRTGPRRVGLGREWQVGATPRAVVLLRVRRGETGAGSDMIAVAVGNESLLGVGKRKPFWPAEELRSGNVM